MEKEKPKLTETDPIGQCLEVTGGGPGRGRECAPFKFVIYHTSDINGDGLCVYEVFILAIIISST